MKRYLIVIVILVNQVVLGQSEFGLDFAGGASRVYKNPKPQSYPSTYDPVFSGQLGLSYSYTFKSHILLSSSIQVNQINGSQKENVLAEQSTDFKKMTLLQKTIITIHT